MSQFIQVGNDRIRLSAIQSYGIRNGVRYLVRDANMAETDQSAYESSFYNYNPEPDPEEPPIYDLQGRPIMMNGKAVRSGSLPEDAYIVEPSRVLYIEESNCKHDRIYHEKTAGFDINAKMEELDKLLGVFQK